MTGDLGRYAAANARVRTLLAALLGRSGLEVLADHPSRATLLDALGSTPYAVAMSGAVTEGGLPLRLVAVGRALLELLHGPERDLVRLYLLRHEVENLKIVIRVVHAGGDRAALAAALVSLPGVATFDARSCVAAMDLVDLVDRLATTIYAGPLRAALPRVTDAGPFVLELALELDYYERLWKGAAALRRPDAARACDLLGVLLDVLNLSWIARHRHALGLSPEETVAYTVPHGRWLTGALVRALAESPESTWDGVLARTPYGRLLGGVMPGEFDAAAVHLWRFLGTRIEAALRGYPFHIGVPLGFLMAQEIEIRDLQVLLAAKDLGVPGVEALEHVATGRR